MTPIVHFIVNTLALKRGGLVKAVRTRANLLAEHQAFDEIWIEVLGFQPALEADVAQLKSAGHLHPDVNVRSVLTSLDTSLAAETRPVMTIGADDYTVFPADATGRAFRLFRDGRYEKYVRLRANRVPAVVDHFGPDRLRMQRDEMDGAGRIVRTTVFRGASTSPVVQHYIGRDGRCFLTIWQTPGKPDWTSAHVFGEDPLAFASTGALYTHAFERIVEQERSAVICSEFRENLYNLPAQNLDDAVRAIDHPRLTKIAVAHSNHLAPPYVAGSGVSPTWARLLRGLDGWDRLVVWTEAQRRDIIADFGHADRIRAIQGVAPPRASSTVEVDPLRLVVVARIHPKKRIDEAVRVFEKVAAEVPDAVLEIFGFGYGDEEEERIESLVEELGLTQSVRFMPFTSDPAKIYGSAGMTLLTSASEGFALTLVESMSFGVPVVAYDSNYGPGEVVQDGVNGYLAPFGDQAGLARRIIQVIRDPTLRARLSAGCFDTLEHFTVERYVREWTDVLNAPPRPEGPISHAEWEGDTLVLHAMDSVAEGTRLLVDERGTSGGSEQVLQDRTWRLTLPAGRTGQLYDLSLRGPDEQSAIRVRFGRMRVTQRRPYRIYATIHGALSIKDESVSTPEITPAVDGSVLRGPTKPARRVIERITGGQRPRRRQ
ncbi:MAG: glycosyltransferase [Micrococcales bacterium]|nr:glycosyltransferase [Micrococcales bacterium]